MLKRSRPESKRPFRPRWTEAEARPVLEEQARSGLSVHAFARSRGLAVTRLYEWKRRLYPAGDQSLMALAGQPSESEPNSSHPEEPLFIPVRVAMGEVRAGGARPVAQEGDAYPLELVMGPRRRLRIGEGFDESTLRRLLRVLDEEAVC